MCKVPREFYGLCDFPFQLDALKVHMIITFTLVMCVLSWSVVSDCDPMDCSLPGSSVHGDYPGKNTRVGCHTLHAPPGDLPNPGIEPRSPTLQADSLLSEPPGKPRKTGVGSLSLLQGNFLTQKSNRGSPAWRTTNGQITNNLHRENSHHSVS